MTLSRFATAAVFVATLALSSGVSKAEGLMHCFFFAPLAEATEADWEAFYKATAELPDKIDGLEDVWAGKLRAPAKVHPEADAREYGVCMLMENAKALQEYAKDPAHAAWEALYFKVRQPGSTTFDIIAE
jgi:hypothetical protein